MIVTKAVFLSLLILTVVTDSAPADERVIDLDLYQDRLKYESDDIHGRDRICRFGTEQEVHNTKGAVSIKCHEKNEHMVYYHNGIKMFPFLKAGTAGGIDLTCPDKPPVILQDCRRWIYDKCPFTCAFGFTYADHRNTTMACELRGPLYNVTAVWSLQEPCVPVSGGKSDVAEISGKTGTSKHPEDGTLNPTQPIPDEASDASPDPKTSATGDEEKDDSTTKIIAISVSTVTGGVIIVVIAIVLIRRRKRNNTKKNPQTGAEGSLLKKSSQDDEESSYTATPSSGSCNGGSIQTVSETHDERATEISPLFTEREVDHSLQPQAIEIQQMHLNQCATTPKLPVDSGQPMRPPETNQQPSKPPVVDSHRARPHAVNRPPSEPSTGVSSSSQTLLSNESFGMPGDRLNDLNSSQATLKTVTSNGGESLFNTADNPREGMSELYGILQGSIPSNGYHVQQQNQRNQKMQDQLKDDDPLKVLNDVDAPLTPVLRSFDKVKVHGKTVEYISGRGQENMGLCSAPDGASSSVLSYPPVPVDSCTANVQLLRNSSRKQYHELRLALEKKSWKDNREEPTLFGYVMQNWNRLGFVNVDDVLSQENKWKNHDPEHLKAEENFMYHLQRYGDTVGMLVEYFSRPVSRNAQAVAIMLDMHVGCPYCEQFRQEQKKASPVV